MRTLTAKKTSLFAVIAATLMVFCVFATTLPADNTSAEESEFTLSSLTSFEKEDLLKITAINAMSNLDTPFKKFSYTADEAYTVNTDMKASEINAAIGEKKVLVVENATVTMDANISGLTALVLKDGAAFKYEPTEGVGTIGTGKVTIGDVVVANVTAVSVYGTAKVAVGTGYLNVKLYISPAGSDDTQPGSVKFDSDDGLNAFTINGKGEDTPAAEYTATVGDNVNYGDTFGTPAIDLLLKLTGKEDDAGDFSVSLKIASLGGNNATDHKTFRAQGFDLSLSNADSGKTTENTKLSYKLDEYYYIEMGDKEISSTLEDITITVDATKENATGKAIFGDVHGYTATDAVRNQLSIDTFNADMSSNGSENIEKLATILDNGPSGIDIQKICKDKLLPDFELKFTTTSFEIRSEATDGSNSTVFSLNTGNQTIEMTGGVLEINAGKVDGNEIRLNKFVGEQSLNTLAENFSLVVNINLYTILEYLIGHVNDNLSDLNILKVLRNLMDGKALDGASFHLKGSHVMIKSWAKIEGEIPQYSEFTADFTGSAMQISVDFDDDKMGINLIIPKITVNEYYVYNGSTASETGENQDITKAESVFEKLSFLGTFRPGAVDALGSVISEESESASSLEFSKVVEYLHTVLKSEEAVSSSEFQLGSLSYATETVGKYNGANASYGASVNVSTTSKDLPVFTLQHSSNKNSVDSYFEENTVLTYESFMNNGNTVNYYATEISGFKITDLNRNTFDTKNFTFVVDNLGAISTETENSKAYFVVLENAAPKLSLTDIESIFENRTPLYKTALESEPVEYFKAEGYNGKVEMGEQYPVSICYDHFDADYCIEYKLAGAEKVTLIPEDVNEDTVVAVISLDENGNIIVDTEGQDHTGEKTFQILLRERSESSVDETVLKATAIGVALVIVLAVALICFAACKRDE